MPVFLLRTQQAGGEIGMRWRIGIVLRFEADGGVGVDVITGCVEQYGGQVGFYRQAAAVVGSDNRAASTMSGDFSVFST